MYAVQNVLGDVSEWSLEFITPIQSILNRSPQGPKTALMRIGSICQSVVDTVSSPLYNHSAPIYTCL